MPWKSDAPKYWGSSQSKKIVMMDLIDGVLPIQYAALPSDLVWEIYRYQPEFVQEKITKSQFVSNLAANRQQLAKRMGETQRQMDAFQHDLDLFPPKVVKANGYLAFHLHDAHAQLKMDIWWFLNLLDRVGVLGIQKLL